LYIHTYYNKDAHAKLRAAWFGCHLTIFTLWFEKTLKMIF